jgi:hypothetical protein
MPEDNKPREIDRPVIVVAAILGLSLMGLLLRLAL